MIKTRSLLAIGMMSGTSMDGIDAAILETDGEGIGRQGGRAAEQGARGD